MTDSRIHNEDVLVATRNADSVSRVHNVDTLAAVVNAASQALVMNVDVLIAQPTKSYWGVWLPDVNRGIV